jgi:hydrogenase maturation protease
MSNVKAELLVIGIGNDGRRDDGLGWALVASLLKKGFVGDTLIRYQLQIEDAELISNYDQVLFIDASKERLPDGYRFQTCLPDLDFSFSTHQLTPSTLLYLCLDLYGRQPTASVLMIEGIEWDMCLGLSYQAKYNLDKALNFVFEVLDRKYFFENSID